MKGKSKRKVILVIKNLFPRLKKTSLEMNSDLIKDGIIDSLELLGLITALEKNYKFNFKKYQKTNQTFKIKDLEKFISK